MNGNPMEKQDSAAARLEDVAARVGVSRSEVSRVLNGRLRAGKDVGAATRQRILETAHEMNYRPHRAAQSLARGRTDIAALMMVINQDWQGSPFSSGGHELSPHYHEIIGSLTYTLSQYGIHLLLAQCGGEGLDPTAAMEKLARTRSCDGMIITDMRVDDRRPQILEETGLPFVVRGSSPKAGVIAVGMDNVAVGYQALKYLHGLGHRRILFYNIGLDLMSGQRRFEGFCQARDEFGLGAGAEYCDGAHHENGAYEALRTRLQSPDFPTAIFAEDEMGAFGALRALSDAGLRVPEDVSVMTCLNARFMRQAAPNLTVLNVRQSEVAAQAGHLLAKMLHGEAVEKRQILLPPLLEERGSTAPPARS